VPIFGKYLDKIWLDIWQVSKQNLVYYRRNQCIIIGKTPDFWPIFRQKNGYLRDCNQGKSIWSSRNHLQSTLRSKIRLKSMSQLQRVTSRKSPQQLSLSVCIYSLFSLLMTKIDWWLRSRLVDWLIDRESGFLSPINVYSQKINYNMF
jgi:hypothetical protein